jgi:HD-like signal output (HDOD) protein/GGDEF domain-containing protein
MELLGCVGLSAALDCQGRSQGVQELPDPVAGREHTMTCPDDVLQPLVLQAGRLYSLPAVAVQVLRLTDDPLIDTQALQRCIENDPALTAKVLRVVNSSLYGLRTPAQTLSQALTRLGIGPLKLLILGFSIPDDLFRDMARGEHFRYWQHALIKAVAARKLAERVTDIDGDEVFLAGLLGQVGQLVLIQVLGSPYIRMLDRVRDRRLQLAQVEQSILEFDHQQLTVQLLKQWSMPDSLLTLLVAEIQPTDDLSSKTQRSGVVLRLAEQLSRLLGNEPGNSLAWILNQAETHLGITSEALELIVTELQETVQQLADVFALDFPAGLNYGLVLETAHQRLIEGTEQAIVQLLDRDSATGGSGQRAANSEEVRTLRAALEVARHGAAACAAQSGVPQTPRGPLTINAGTAVQRPSTPGGVVTKLAPSGQGAACASLSTAGDLTPDANLADRVAVAVSACRHARSPLSLLLVELEGYEEAIFNLGVDGAQRQLVQLQDVCCQLDVPKTEVVLAGEATLAVILAGCDRTEAVRAGNQLIREYHDKAATGVDADLPTSLSVGLASISLPPKNFPAQDLIQGADRCLYGSRQAGGDSLKSIEIY